MYNLPMASMIVTDHMEREFESARRARTPLPLIAPSARNPGLLRRSAARMLRGAANLVEPSPRGTHFEPTTRRSI